MGVINKISLCLYMIPMSLLSPSLFLSLLTVMVEGKMNCGLNCYRWAKCMGQLDGSNRPGELGDTGIIVLNTCTPMEGKCNCAGLVLESLSSTPQPTTRKSKFTPNRALRRKGRKFSEVKPAKYEKEEKKSLVKTKRKYKRFQKKQFIEEASTEETTTVNQELVKNSRNRKRKLRMRKRL